MDLKKSSWFRVTVSIEWRLILAIAALVFVLLLLK